MNGDFKVFTTCGQCCSWAALFLLVSKTDYWRNLKTSPRIRWDKEWLNKFLQMECNGIKCHLSLFFSKLRHSKQEIQQHLQFYSSTFISIKMIKIPKIKKYFLSGQSCVDMYMKPVQVLDTEPRGNDVGLNHFLCINRKLQLKVWCYSFPWVNC